MTVRSAFALAAALITVVVLGLSAAAPGSAAAGPATPLSNDIVQNLNLATLHGAVSSTKKVTVGIFLSNPRQAAEDTFVAQLYDPNSANYHQFLTPDEFNTRFGVPAAEFQAAEAWAQGRGLTVHPVEVSHNYFLATGTAAQVEAAFHTPLNRYTDPVSGRNFYSNTQIPTVPASLGISDVLGLNNFNRLMTPITPQPAAATNTTGPAPSDATTAHTGLLSIKELWSIYDAPPTNAGNGASMAIIGWGVTTPVIPDLRSFEAEWGLPRTPIWTKYYGDTSTPDTNDGATVEWELDTQASTGMAPNVAKEALFFAHHNTDTDALAAFAGWVNNKTAPLQASASFGECENIGNNGAILTDGMEVPGDQILEQGVAEGRTLFASTGDTGSSCGLLPPPPVLGSWNGVGTNLYPGLEWPSVSPWAVAVGGTVLHGDGNSPEKRLDESAWTYTGGGNSTSEPAGSYQTGVAPTNCAFDPNGNPYTPGTAAGPICRSTPDVATMSGDVFTGNGMLVNDDAGPDSSGGGTSLSSPLWLGVWTRIQAAAAPATGLGFANYSIYKLAQQAPGRDFYDVTVGDNQPYPAKPGYDNTTGWGTPEISQLMLDLTGRLTPTNDVAPAPVVVPSSTQCGTVFTDAAGDDNYTFSPASTGPGTYPQLDLLSGRVVLSPDGKTLRTILTVKNLTTDVPTGGGENTYQVTFSYGGTLYFTQLAVEPGGNVLAWDGQLVRVSLENKYLQEHNVTGKITPGPNGTVEVDAPIADFPGIAAGQTLLRPSGATYVREGVNQGPLEPADSAGPSYNAKLGACAQ